MKLFQVLLSSYDQTIALVVGAKDLESAEALALDEYNNEELSVYRSYEIAQGSAHEEFVCEIFNTNEL